MLRKIITEGQMVTLVEERGVAVSPWKKEIDAIILYIRKYVKDNVDETLQDITFSVPEELANVFNFLINPTFLVTARYEKDNKHKGSGLFGPKPNGEIKFVNNAIQGAIIAIHCYYNDKKKVWLNNISHTIYHEMNHAYELWITRSRTSSFRYFNTTTNKSNAGLDIRKKFPIIGNTVYSLFSETEYKAIVASVFGDLEGLNSTLVTFGTDYKKTIAYNIYSKIKLGLKPELEKLSNEEAKSLLNLLRSKQISLNLKANTVASFKHAFESKANKLLNELLHDIGRVASFYYDKKAEEILNGNVSTIE